MPKENKSVKPIKEYYIAYFDLLGYKNFFKTNPEKAGDFLNTIYEAIQNTKKYIQEVNSSFIIGEIEKVSIKTKIFSDNFLLCLERSFDSMEYLRFLTFISIVADIQRNFILQYDLSLRGGITIGMLSVNNDFIFGEGLIEAVALEETAKYPRIIMSKTVLDYVLQTHFVKSEDLKKACEIENRAHAGEYISDKELAFCNAIVPAVNMEKFYLQWRDHLIFKTADETVVLNYLYYIDINTMIDQITKEQILEFVKTISPSDYRRLGDFSPDQKQWLEQHKAHIIQKIKEFGKYDDLEISAINEADVREHILKKYLWVLSFHNYVCMVYHVPECMIKSGSACDIRFMRITAEIFEDNP
ncbi:MAG: hypothetical protein HDR09_10100 [Lachnospiraceae bacterium]|nr:hypothetical protein [Lachnospiraceae bacterium]